MNTIIISPQDALSQIHCPIKLYKQIEVYVEPLLVLDVNGILCHRIRGSNNVPLALQPLLKETIPVKLYRDPFGHVCNTHVVARTDLTLFLESLRETLYSCYGFLPRRKQ